MAEYVSPSGSPRDAPPSFPLFSNLPPELRAPIWEYSLPGPRILAFRNGHHVINIPWCIAINPIDATLQALLQTCQESRAVVLAHYQQCFAANIGRPIWFSGSKDILHFHTLQSMDEFFTATREDIRADITTVRTVAVGTPPSMRQPNETWARFFKPENVIPLAWMRFGGLTEIIMLQPAFSKEKYLQTVKSLRKGPTKMQTTMERFTRSRDRYVVKRRLVHGDSDADEAVGFNITTEDFEEFWKRAG
ncbi:hypothetical protein BKA65DRAFT_496284 [Rhexocercosporidium sp. MPI-PUGE-AT-0058]|nr:hypothetical protein BKA65DRAFT_496284 [Rhexocercosporidium sp. MPI-PUGE-AT-0058]